MTDYSITTRILVRIPQGYPPQTRERIARAIVRKIVSRTLKGVDKNGIEFKPYTKAYTDSLVFQQARKSEDTVTLRLTNQMLSSIRLIDHEDGELLIGIDDMSQTAKAYNHIVGDTLPRRNFLGISDVELAEILNEFPLPRDAERFEQFAEDFVVTSPRTDKDLTMKELKEVSTKLVRLADLDGFVTYKELLSVLGSRKKIIAFIEASQLLGRVYLIGDLDDDIKGVYLL